jgi:hypothetical protein
VWTWTLGGGCQQTDEVRGRLIVERRLIVCVPVLVDVSNHDSDGCVFDVVDGNK